MKDICAPGYTRLARKVPSAVKERVYLAYGRKFGDESCCELDHLIALELGGSNRFANLWPEPFDTEWNARAKDRVENKLHRLVCAGRLDLETAQRSLAVNWIAAYQRYVDPATPRTAPRREHR